MGTSGLIVRRSERFEISLPARVRIGLAHAESVQFAKGVSDSERWVEVDVVDFAEGGVGFVSDIILPRGVILEILIPELSDGDDGVIIQSEIKVQRVQMTDRRPAYLIGSAFHGLDEEGKDHVQRVLSRFLDDDESKPGMEGYDA